MAPALPRHQLDGLPVEAEVKYPRLPMARVGWPPEYRTGAHYAVWVYPEYLIGKSNILVGGEIFELGNVDFVANR